MKVNNITRLMVACLWCCCTLVFAKTHIDDQVDPEIAKKVAIEEAAKAKKEVKVHDHIGDCEEIHSKKLKVSDAYAPLTPEQIQAKDSYYDQNGQESFKSSDSKSLEAFIESFESNSSSKSIESLEVREQFLNKGYTVEEYIQAVNAAKESMKKENAVSFEQYLEGLNAKEQATSLEYNLQTPNNGGEIVDNKRGPKIPLKLLKVQQKAT